MSGRHLVPVPSSFLEELAWWARVENLCKGVPFVPLPLEFRLYSDMSDMGWVAHMDRSTVDGRWTMEERFHFNWKELIAVIRAMNHFRHRLQGHSALVLTDNTKVIGQLKNEGGMKAAASSILTRSFLLWLDDNSRHSTFRASPMSGQIT